MGRNYISIDPASRAGAFLIIEQHDLVGHAGVFFYAAFCRTHGFSILRGGCFWGKAQWANYGNSPLILRENRGRARTPLRAGACEVIVRREAGARPAFTCHCTLPLFAEDWSNPSVLDGNHCRQWGAPHSTDGRGCGLPDLQVWIRQQRRQHLGDVLMGYSPEKLNRGQPDLRTGVLEQAKKVSRR